MRGKARVDCAPPRACQGEGEVPRPRDEGSSMETASWQKGSLHDASCLSAKPLTSHLKIMPSSSACSLLQKITNSSQASRVCFIFLCLSLSSDPRHNKLASASKHQNLGGPSSTEFCEHMKRDAFGVHPLETSWSNPRDLEHNEIHIRSATHMHQSAKICFPKLFWLLSLTGAMRPHTNRKT